MKIIDIHCHPDWGGYHYDKLIANMDEYGIDQAWILPWQSPHDEYPQWTVSSNAALGPDGPVPFANALAFKQRNPERFILGFAPDPRRPESIDLLKSYISLYDVKVYGEYKLRMMMDDPDAIDMYRFCGGAGLPVLMHLDYPIIHRFPYPRKHWWYCGDIETLARAMRLCPETNFLGHAPGFWAHISGDGAEKGAADFYPEGPVLPGGRIQALLEECPNFYCDMAGPSGWNALNRDQEHAKKFIVAYQDRLLYGRDLFCNRHQELIFSLGLPEPVLEKIFHLNAERLIGC
jgi:predicted TIM-barrel fold metal-dependent hydrolase